MTETKQATKAVGVTSSSNTSSHTDQQGHGSLFISMAIDMSWRLAIVILLPIIGGVELDKALNLSPACTIAGFLLAMAGMAWVMWQTLQTANRLPVPKLTAAQKRAIKKQYDEDDDDA